MCKCLLTVTIICVSQRPVVVQGCSSLVEDQQAPVTVVVTPVASTMPISKAVFVIDVSNEPQAFAAIFYARDDVSRLPNHAGDARIVIRNQECWVESYGIVGWNIRRRSWRRKGIGERLYPDTAAQNIGGRSSVILDFDGEPDFARRAGTAWSSNIDRAGKHGDDLVTPQPRLMREDNIGAFNGSRVFIRGMSGPPLQAANERQNDRQEGNHPIRPVVREPVPPVSRRLLIALGSVLAWGLSLLIGEWRDDWHPAVVGTIILASGLFLWCLTPFRWTWGWWL